MNNAQNVKKENTKKNAKKEIDFDWLIDIRERSECKEGECEKDREEECEEECTEEC